METSLWGSKIHISNAFPVKQKSNLSSSVPLGMELFCKNKNKNDILQWQGFEALDEIEFQKSSIDWVIKHLLTFQTF